jgi:hypothetical protein
MSDPHSPHRPPERPRVEPEIIPPGAQPRGRYPGGSFGGSYRVYVAQPGPFTLFALLLLAGLVVVALVLFVVGAVLFWIPLVALVVGGLIAAAYARYYWFRLKARFGRR